MMAQAGHIPSEDEEIEVDGYRLVAGNVRGQRIGSVTVEALEKRPALHLEEHIPAALVVDSAPAPAAEPAEPSAPSAPSAPSSLDVETDGRAIAGASDRPEERLDAKADARADE